MSDNEEVVYGGKVSNRYGGKDLADALNTKETLNYKGVEGIFDTIGLSPLTRTSWEFFFRAVCDEIITTTSEEVFERTNICGDTSKYTYYIMKTYLYGPEEAYIMVLKSYNDIETCPMLKKGHMYTLSLDFSDHEFTCMSIIPKEKFNKNAYIFDSNFIDEVSMTSKTSILVFDKDVIPDKYACTRIDLKTLREDGIDPYKNKDKIKGVLNVKYIARF